MTTAKSPRIPNALLHVWGPLVLVGLCGPPCPAEPPTEWTTLQHDATRTGYSPVRVEPPYRIRWFWVNGNRFDPNKDKLPPMIQTWISRRAQPVLAHCRRRAAAGRVHHNCGSLGRAYQSLTEGPDPEMFAVGCEAADKVIGERRGGARRPALSAASHSREGVRPHFS